MLTIDVLLSFRLMSSYVYSSNYILLAAEINFSSIFCHLSS